MVLEAVLAGVPDRAVQPGRALERRLAVERGVDPAGQHVGRTGTRRPRARRCGTSAAARPRRPRRRRPASRARRSRRGAARRRPGTSRLSTSRRPRPPPAGRCRPRSSRSRSAISRPARLSPSFAHRPAGPGELAGAAGDHDRQRAAEAAQQRQVGVPEHEAADQLGAVLGRARGVGRGRLVERRVAGREDRGVVDQTGPTHRRVAPD